MGVVKDEMWSRNSMERHDSGRAVPGAATTRFQTDGCDANMPLALWPCGLQGLQGCGRANDEGHPRAPAVFCVRAHKRGREWVVPNRSGGTA
jgi:hypothetical protein